MSLRRTAAVALSVSVLAACQVSVAPPPVDPTASASAPPSAAPSVAPSVAASTAPSAEPSVEATTSPTEDPNAMPTLDPAATGPAVEPSALPSAEMSMDPSLWATPSPVPSSEVVPDSLSGTVLEEIALPVENPYDIAVDPDGNLWVTTPNEDKALHKLAPDGKLIASFTEAGTVDVGVDAAGRIRTCSTNTKVLDRATGKVLASYPITSSHLAFDAAGALWTTTYFDADLIKVGGSGTKEATFSLAPRDWNGGMAFDPDGNVWITGRKESSEWEIVKVGPDGKILKRFKELAMSVAFGDGDVANLVVNDTVKQLDLDGKAVGNFTIEGASTLVDITPDGQGNWLVLDSANAKAFRVKL